MYSSMAKGTSQAEVTSNSEPIALAIVESEASGWQAVSQSVENSVK